MPDVQVTVTGATELAEKLREAGQGLPNEVESSFYLALQPIQQTIATYPARPPTRYIRTGAYGRTVGIATGTYGGQMVATVGPNINGVVPYAEFLRGNTDGYPGAYMHVDYWESLQSIQDRMAPDAVSMIQEAIDDYIISQGLG